MQATDTPTPQIRNIDQVHSNQAYLPDDYSNGQSTEKIWIKQTKL